MKTHSTIGFVILMISLMAGTSAVSDDCACRKPKKSDTTRWGGNQTIVVPLEKSYRELRGTVEMPDGRVLENALVEIFDNAEYLLRENRERPQQTRLAACVTGPDGKFGFRHLPAGTYELRSSIGNGWDVTHVHVKVDQRTGVSEKIRMKMYLGT
jgi:carboxypeptidase family protein